MEKTKFKDLQIKTQAVISDWKNPKVAISENAKIKLNKFSFDRLEDLTNALEFYVDKGLRMTDDELIAAEFELVAVVELWLKFFYCFYYDDYSQNPIKNRRNETVEPEDASFEELKDFRDENLWDDLNFDIYEWFNSVYQKSKAINSSERSNVGTPSDFLKDVELLDAFADGIINRLHPVEDQSEDD